MSKTILSTVLTTTLLLTSTSALAGQIDGAINADNRFVVAVTSNGNVVSRYDSPGNYSWRTKDTFSLSTPDDIKQCRINVIVWGDNAVAEGFAGVLRGNNGQIYTGGTGSNGFQSATESVVTSGGISSLPTDNEIIAMTPAPAGTGATGSAPANISSPVWGAVSGYYQGSDFIGGSVPSNMAWVKPQSTGTTTDNHWVFSSPCGDLVKPVAVHMPGDHFQCYSLKEGEALEPETIYIRDQFGESKAVLGKPRVLCNPSMKTHKDKTYDILNAERHLVCYDYVKRPQRRENKVSINNQFAPDDVVAGRNQFFCVPSSKKHIK